MKPQWHPYLFIIFFATLFEYNLQRLIIVVSNKKALQSDKHKWLRDHLNTFYVLVFISVAGFVSFVSMAQRDVLITLLPIAIITLFYSTPVFGKKNIFRLREIPYLKIFLISFVWSTSTIMLPIIQSDIRYNWITILIMTLERFLFVFAITIPFDIRDRESDRQAGLKTIPMLLTENKSFAIAYLALFSFFLISFFHYQLLHYRIMVISVSISALTTFLILYSKKMRTMQFYHYGILDGSMLFQGLLVVIVYLLRFNL